ncbi:4Fe-4S dicluster domain-containing protein [Sideroxydans sp. CL21]|uniref:4Fe-4S dicluster domain-containing protein n=1 Tax=Sideroxydans sp. CL21 TaxID=2600596 RepID=UPI0024BC8991|nr:4Fe-4S dicluster domain-containing protein [Sideroxydans sp. CL21]
MNKLPSEEKVTTHHTKLEEEAGTLSRRDFLGFLGKGAACAGAFIGAGAAIGAVEAETGKHAFQQNDAQYEEAVNNPPKIPEYNWNDHQWAMGVDTTRCIGCLRCMEACKMENSVQMDANHHRTWVERYVYLEGSNTALVDSQTDPKNIENAGSETKFRFDDRYRNVKVDKAFFVAKLCNQCEHPSCVQVCPTGATFKSKDGPVLIDTTYCIGCQYCVQACPYGARSFNESRGTAEKCNWCYHRITKGLNPACVEVCPTGSRIFGDRNDPESAVSVFIRNNHVQVLKPEMGNAPNVFYKGTDKEVV